MSDTTIQPQALLLSRAKVCQMLSITVREFYALINAGKLHPLQTRQRHMRVPLAEVMSIKAEFAHRTLAMPYEKFIQAATFFTSNAVEVNGHLLDLGYPKAPVEYIQRCRAAAESDAKLDLIRVKTFGEFMVAFGRAQEILKRGDLRLLVELLTMMQKTESEIQQTIRGKYGRDYAPADVLRFIEYFWNWRTMDPESVQFYMEYVQGREKVLKECAYRRADYFIYYALGIDFGGEVAELLERSCLGLIHKLNFLIDGYVYGNSAVSQKDLESLTNIISELLGAASQVRAGKVPKGKQGGLADMLIPQAITRDKFFDAEKAAQFKKV
jgi:hypothetical protein